MTTAKKPFVAVLMGSGSDADVMENTVRVLRQFEVRCETHICSAHRQAERLEAYMSDAESRGCAVFIAAAGMAAHLAGAVAARSCLPVIGVPLAASLNGLDALLSTVQMPAGVPVASVAIGSAGARNAAYLAVQILALQDAKLAEALQAERAERRAKLEKDDEALQARLGD